MLSGRKPRVRLEKNFVAATQVLQVNCRDGAVGDGQKSPLLGADASGAQADVFDHAGAIAETANIAHTKHFVAEHGDAAEEISNGLLCAEADGNAANTEAGERCAHVEAEVSQDCESTDAENECFDDALAEQHERTGTGVSAGQGAIAHAAQ